jgi:acyl dehydratase
MENRPERGKFYEDLPVGTTICTEGRTIEGNVVDAFAGVTGDFASVHTDAIAARKTIYGEQIAHGLLSLSILQGLMAQTRYLLDTGLASLGWDAVKFIAPVRLGDTVYGEFTIREARLSTSRPNAGIVVEDCRLTNQEGTVVLTGRHISMIKCRASTME